MDDHEKTKDELIEEIQNLRKKLRKSNHIGSGFVSAEMNRACTGDQYLELVNNAPFAIFVVQDGLIKIPNPGTAMIYGLTESELMTKPFLDCVYKADRENVLKNYSEDDLLQPGSYSFRIKGDELDPKWTELQALPFFWNGRPASLCYQTDISRIRQEKENLQMYQEHLEEITELRTSELLESLKKAERANEVKDSFLANMSHEFQTPIHQINSYSLLGLKKVKKTLETATGEPQEKLLKYFEHVHFASERLFAFMTGLFDLVKLEAGEIQYQFIMGNILRTIKAAQLDIADEVKEKDLVIEILEPDVPVELEFDPYWIDEVLKNLLSNAVKFSSQGGRVTISFKQNQIIQFDSSREGLQIDIADQGVGLPEDELDLVFEKFTQSTRTEDGSGGRGIGLAICRQIIVDHGGTIQARNNPDSGSTFSITIPYQQTTVDSGIKVHAGYDSF